MSKQLPYLKISGSYAEIGTSIGAQFRDLIQKAVKDNREEIPNYVSVISKCDPYIKETRKYLPHLLIEAEHIAKVAGVPLDEYFLINNREVYDVEEAVDFAQATNIDHCTVVAGFGPDGLVVGHNEDWSIDAIDRIYILEATIGSTTFIGLNYQATIPGVSAMMNNFGLIQCINDLYQTNQVGVPKNFIARAVLECKTLDEAEKLIRDIPRASGFNHVLAQGDEIRNIELAGSQMAVQRSINQPFAHTNHYLSSELANLEKFHTSSSEARLERAIQMLAASMSKEDVIQILRDTTNTQHPICRSDHTIASAVFLPQSKTASFCYGHPCAGEYLEYKI